MRSIVGKLLGLTAMAVALTLSATVGSVNAATTSADPATNLKKQYLAADPTSRMANSVVERRIYLAAGNYIWKLHTNDVKRTISLGAGWYTWRDVLVPDGAPYSREKIGFYHHYSQLDPDNPSWATAELSTKWIFNDNGTKWWGSHLLPQF